MKQNIATVIGLIATLAVSASCGKSLEQYPHTAIQPEAVAVTDLPAVRFGMYNSVEEDPGTLSYIIFDIVGGDVSQNVYHPIDIINANLAIGIHVSSCILGRDTQDDVNDHNHIVNFDHAVTVHVTF